MLVLGRGTFGKVYLAKAKGDDEQKLFAIKTVRKDVLIADLLLKKSEQNVLLNCLHPFLTSIDYIF